MAIQEATRKPTDAHAFQHITFIRAFLCGTLPKNIFELILRMYRVDIVELKERKFVEKATLLDFALPGS